MNSVTVADYMARNLVTFKPETNVFAALKVFLEKKISGAPVVNDAGDLVGILSEVDVLKVVTRGSYYDDTAGVVGDYMHKDVETIDPGMNIYALAELFLKDHRRRYPVLSDGRLVGQISRRDVLRAMEVLVKMA